jgi:hypothetical protein
MSDSRKPTKRKGSQISAADRKARLAEENRIKRAAKRAERQQWQKDVKGR